MACAVTAAMLLQLPGVQARAGDSPVAAVLRKHGIRPVVPPTPATDFTLPNLQGNEISLSSTHGRWVLLTFFATWCGPCATEMPSLEVLHQTREAEGLRVLGVAIENDANKVKAFTAGRGVTFPVLLDGSSQVASIYRASSIPTSYLIDPLGRLVGVARGARNWSADNGALFQDLITVEPPSEDVVGSYRQGQQPVELPSTLVPPEAEVKLASAGPIRVEEPFDLQVIVRWAGNFQDYLLLPPQVHSPDGIITRGTSAITSTEQGDAVITYQVSLEAQRPGSFALDPVELRYTPHAPDQGAPGQPVARRIGGPTVEVVAASASPWLLGGAGAGLLGMMSAVAVLLRRRRGRGERESAPAPLHELLAQHLEDAKRAKMRGDALAWITALIAFEQACPEGDATALQPLLEKVRYAGYTPPAHEQDALLRAAGRRLAKLTPQADPTEHIKLKDPTEGNKP